MTSYIRYVSPEGLSCSQYYHEYCGSTVSARVSSDSVSSDGASSVSAANAVSTIGVIAPLSRDEFDKLVSSAGYYKSRPSAIVSADRKWRWKKIDF